MFNFIRNDIYILGCNFYMAVDLIRGNRLDLIVNQPTGGYIAHTYADIMEAGMINLAVLAAFLILTAIAIAAGFKADVKEHK